MCCVTYTGRHSIFPVGSDTLLTMSSPLPIRTPLLLCIGSGISICRTLPTSAPAQRQFGAQFGAKIPSGLRSQSGTTP